MPDAPRNVLSAALVALVATLGVAAPMSASAEVDHAGVHAAEEHVGTGMGLHGGPDALPASYDTDAHAGHGHADDHGEHGEDHGEANLFAGSILQSLAAIVAFVLLLLILRKYAWGQILTGLQDRENKIKDDLQHARTQREEAQAVLADYEKQRKGLQAEGQAIIDEARKAGEAVKVKLVADAEAHAGRLRERAEKEIVAAKETAIAEVYEKSAVLSTEIASKILGRELNADDQQGLVSDSLREFEGRMATNN